jgi:hypothetical protein
MLTVLEEWDDERAPAGAANDRRGSKETPRDRNTRAKRLFNLTNHELTPEQTAQARKTLGTAETVTPPEELRQKLANIPPDEPDVAGHISDLGEWLRNEAESGDVVLVQGEHGATYSLVDLASRLGAIPMHATTERKFEEVRSEDGSVTTKRVFRHVRFRPYSRMR